MQVVQAALDGSLEDIIATAATWDPAATFVGVGTALVDHGIETVLADITKATGAMAPALAVTGWGDVMHLANGSSAVEGPLMTFSPANAGEGQTLAVWYVGNLATSSVLKAYAPIVPPITLPDEFSSFNIVLRLTLDPNGQWSAEVIWNG